MINKKYDGLESNNTEKITLFFYMRMLLIMNNNLLFKLKIELEVKS